MGGIDRLTCEQGQGGGERPRGGTSGEERLGRKRLAPDAKLMAWITEAGMQALREGTRPACILENCPYWE